MSADLVTALLIFSRIGALLAVFPLWSVQQVPIPLRIGSAVLISAILLPLVPAASMADASMLELVLVILKEVSVGLILGFLCRIVFGAVELAGNIVASEMGFSTANLFNPMAGTSESIPAIALYWMTLLLMLTGNLHHSILAALVRSFDIVPIGTAVLHKEMLPWGLRYAGQMFGMALQMTAPVLGCSFLASLVLSLLGRAVPQMNVFAESFPVRTLATLTVFGLTCNLMSLHISNYLKRVPMDMLQAAQWMSPQ